jgi:hypothetical protein
VEEQCGGFRRFISIFMEGFMGNFIKRGVTIYSFKELVSEGRLSWEECIAAIVNMGITGVELLGQLFFRECPEVNREDNEKWQKMMLALRRQDGGP